MKFQGGKKKTQKSPLLHILDPNFPPSVANLDPALTINGSTVYPTFRYKGGDANGTIWMPWGYGEILTLTGAGAAPSYNQGSPLLGSDDDSVKFNGTGGSGVSGKSYNAGNNTYGNVGTNDLVLETVLRLDNSYTGVILAKRHGLAGGWGAGWQLYTEPGYARVYLEDGSSNSVGLEWVLTNNYYAHLIAFLDASGNAVMFLNGVQSAAVSAAVLTNIDSAAVVTIGGYSDQTYGTNVNMCYCAMWQAPAWLDTHLQADVAEERFYKLTGVYPQQARGTAIPTTCTRDSVAYLNKLEADGTTKYYLVGKNWPRVCKRLDDNGAEVIGYLSESSAENNVTQNIDISAWGANHVSIDSAAVNTPHGTITNITIHEDSDDDAHYVSVSVSGTWTATNKYLCSFYAKSINRGWVRPVVYDITNGYAVCARVFFDLDNCLVGTEDVGNGYIKNMGNGWCKCWLMWTQATTSNTLGIFTLITTADTVVTHQGLDQDAVYFYGAQIEPGTYPSSLIETAASAVTRASDGLEYNITNLLPVSKAELSADVFMPIIPSTTKIALELGTGDLDGTIQYHIKNTGVVEFWGRQYLGGPSAIISGVDVVAGIKTNMALKYKLANASSKTINAVSTETTNISYMYTCPDWVELEIGRTRHDGTLNFGPGLISNIKLKEE